MLRDFIYMQYLKIVKLIKAENRMVVAKDWWGERNEKFFPNGYKVSLYKISSRDLLYNTVSIVNYMVFIKIC